MLADQVDQLHVIYLELAHCGRGAGSRLRVTEQQRSLAGVSGSPCSPATITPCRSTAREVVGVGQRPYPPGDSKDVPELLLERTV